MFVGAGCQHLKDYVDSSQIHQLAFLFTIRRLGIQTALESIEENKSITMAFSLSNHGAAEDIVVYLVLEELNPCQTE